MVFLQKIEACILQNNAVNIFEEYFEGLEPAPIVEQSSARTMYVYKDVETPTVSFRIKSTELWFLIKIDVPSFTASLWIDGRNKPPHSSSDQLVIYHGRPMADSKLPSRTATRASMAFRANSRPTRTSGRPKIQINRFTSSQVQRVHRYVSNISTRTSTFWWVVSWMDSAACGTSVRASRLCQRHPERFVIVRAPIVYCGSIVKPTPSFSRAAPMVKLSGGIRVSSPRD